MSHYESIKKPENTKFPGRQNSLLLFNMKEQCASCVKFASGTLGHHTFIKAVLPICESCVYLLRMIDQRR